MIPDKNRVLDSEVLVTIVQYSHFPPRRMMGTITLQDSVHAIRRAFRYESELASVVLTPSIVWFSLPPCALVIVEFSREFTVHDGLGYVCTVALPCFDFQRHGNVKVRHALYLNSACRLSPLRVHAQFGAPTKVPDARPMSNDGKMEIYFVSIKAMHPERIPADLTGARSTVSRR